MWGNRTAQHTVTREKNFPAVCLPQSNVALDARSFQRRPTLAAYSCVNVGDRRQEAICQRAIVAFSILASIKACPSRGSGMKISLATGQTLLGGCCG